jgi:hypothetical protein
MSLARRSALLERAGALWLRAAQGYAEASREEVRLSATATPTVLWF